MNLNERIVQLKNHADIPEPVLIANNRDMLLPDPGKRSCLP